MCKIFNFLFSWGFFVFAIALGVALWFAINYVDQFRLESSFYDIGEIFMMAAVFGIVFYLAAAIFIIPIKAMIKKA
ncbi:hypothetical protein [Campylobacter sp.]|jgi:hypothetical protein|uniref:hypothetical protein n=1 Tax=Campylobacter sp. TaxID=205 RepID=UPI003FA088C9